MDIVTGTFTRLTDSLVIASSDLTFIPSCRSGNPTITNGKKRIADGFGQSSTLREAAGRIVFAVAQKFAYASGA